MNRRPRALRFVLMLLMLGAIVEGAIQCARVYF